MNIDLKIIPHHKQRFTTLGDWKMCGNTLRVRISRLSDWRFEMAVFAHEFLEFIITHHQGITTKECDKFDAWFETQYDQGLMPKSVEAGFDKRCPYRKGHLWGSRIERFVIWILGASWKKYCEEADELMGVEK